MAANLAALMNASKASPTKLTGTGNYRTWAKDLELILVRMGCWEVTKNPPPPEAERTVEWTANNNWARSEIHLWCSPEQQQYIIDSELAFDSWNILASQHNSKSELKTLSLRKEFSAVRMTEPDCQQYIDKVKKMASQLKAYGDRIKDSDVAFTLLSGLGPQFGSLVVTLTNMATPDRPLELGRVTESILTEELRLKSVLTEHSVSDKNVDNPLAFKPDSSFKGSLSSALVARTQPHAPYPYPYPYPSGRGTYIPRYYSRPGYPYGSRNPRGGPARQSPRPPAVVPPVVSQGPTSTAPTPTPPWHSVPLTWPPPSSWSDNNPSSWHDPSSWYPPWQVPPPVRCYGCGMWGHLRRNCYKEHPELRPGGAWVHDESSSSVDHAPPQTNSVTPATPVTETAHVTLEQPPSPSTDELDAEYEFEHPFELNMLMFEDGHDDDPNDDDLSNGIQRLQQFRLAHSSMIATVKPLHLGIVLESAHTHVVHPISSVLPNQHHVDKHHTRRWILDSGASSHYIRDISRFRSFSWLEVPVKVSTGKGPLWGLARGEVELVVLIGRIIIGGVLLIPDLDVESDLLSVAALMDKGFGVTFEKGKAHIHKDNKVWATASPDTGHAGLCYLDEFELVQHFALTSSCIDKQPIEIWHKRLGHIQQRSIRSMTAKVTGMVIGPPTKNGDRNIDCVDCIRGTQHQHISRFPFTKASRPLERVSFDIAGKMRLPDCTWNYQYLLVLVDHFTRYTWVFPLITRDMAIRAFEIFKASAENQCQHRLLVIQSDNAKEFVGKKWTKFCQSNGIEHITSQPYAPGMNSYVERVIRTIVNHASIMLWASGVSEAFWALACKASAYLLNRSPHSSLDDNITPYESWHGKKPHVGHIRVWGCRAYAAVLKERRTKFDSKSRDCILVGFYDVENLYQLWDVVAKQSIKCRDVIFHEHILGHPEVAREPILANRLITGVDRVPHDEDDEDDSVEEMYPVLSDIKPDIWNDMPASHLPMHEQILDNVPTTYEQAIASSRAIEWAAACNCEFESMLHNKVFIWAELPPDQMALPSKWIFVIKRRLDGTVEKYKARIVAGGHRQREGIDFQETYAPVAKFVSLRILLTMAALDDLEGEQCDIVTAFLYGDLDEVVYMRSPPGVCPKPGDQYMDALGQLQIISDSSPPLYWHLKKSLYGLRQSPRCFYKKLDGILGTHGYRRVASDYGVWIAQETLIIVHVDDMQLLGTHAGLERILTVLGDNFLIKRMGPIGTHLFLSLQIERWRQKRLISIRQSIYARQILHKFEMLNCTPCHIPMDPKEDWNLKDTDTPLPDKTVYQSAIGSLIYLMLGSRPDLAFSINRLAQYSSQTTIRHWNGVKRILRYVKGTINAKLTLGQREGVPVERVPALREALGKREGVPAERVPALREGVPDLLVYGYFDAAFMDNTLDRHSSMGYIFFVADSLVSWTSKKQRVVALSTTEAEYLAGTEETKEAIWIQHFLTEIGISKDRIAPITLFGDNQSAIALARNPEYHARTKHIQGKQRFITEMVEQGVITVQYVPTANMIADTLTKALPRERYTSLMKLMGVDPNQRTCTSCSIAFTSNNDLHKHLKSNPAHMT